MLFDKIEPLNVDGFRNQSTGLGSNKLVSSCNIIRSIWWEYDSWKRVCGKRTKKVREILRGNLETVAKSVEFGLTDTTCGVTERRVGDDRKTIILLCIMISARISPATAVIKGTGNILSTRMYCHGGRGMRVPPVYRAHVISDLFTTRETADNHNTLRASRAP